MTELTTQDVLQATDLGQDLTVDDWPFGRIRQCSMHFFVESGKRGQRLVRQSTMNGRTYKPKKDTYATGVKLVELGGKTGYIKWSDDWQHLTVCKHDGNHIQTFFDTDARIIARHFGLV